MPKKAVGLLALFATLALLGYATGVMDGSDPARWCAERDREPDHAVTQAMLERDVSWGQACLDLYEIKP